MCSADHQGPAAVGIKRLGPEDQGLARETIRRLTALDNPGLSEADHLRRFLARPENVLIVARKGTMPVGFILAYILDRLDRDGKMVLLYEIAVTDADRRRGIGRAMVEALKRVCQAEHAVKMWGLTNRSNTAALRLYESTGGVANASDDDVSFLYTSDRLA